MCRDSLLFHEMTENRKRGFSLVHTRHASSLCICSSRSIIRTSARIIRSYRGWCPRYIRYLHVRGCDFGNHSTRAMLNCKKQINLEMQERLKTSAHRKFFNDYDWMISNWFLLVLPSCTLLECNERELTIQWRSCSDSICFNSIKLSVIIKRKLNSNIAMNKKLHAESRESRIR